jgi:hypothetical protein
MVFVENNPQYLSGVVVNKTEKFAIVNSLSRGIENLKETVSPLDVLRQKLSRENLVEAQWLEFSDIYTNFEFKEDEKNYKLLDGLLMIIDDYEKILVPPSLVGPLLAHLHLSGHKGLTRMLLEM